MPFRAVPQFDLRVADVGFVSQERWSAIDLEDNVRGAPDLVIEVKSESNTWPELRERASLCLGNGCRDFWIVEGKARTITVIAPDGRAWSIRLQTVFHCRYSTAIVCRQQTFSNRIESDADSPLHRQFQVLRQL